MAVLATLLLGFVIGFLGQRSRLCFVSGYRDFVVMRNTEQLKSVWGALIGAILAFTLFSFLGGFVPLFPLLFQSPRSSMMIMWVAVIIGGLGVGVLGGLAGACPFRMHVMAAEGKRTPLFYLGGFYVGMVFFNVLTEPFLQSLGFVV